MGGGIGARRRDVVPSFPSVNNTSPPPSLLSIRPPLPSQSRCSSSRAQIPPRNPLLSPAIQEEPRSRREEGKGRLTFFFGGGEAEAYPSDSESSPRSRMESSSESLIEEREKGEGKAKREGERREGEGKVLRRSKRLEERAGENKSSTRLPLKECDF